VSLFGRRATPDETLRCSFCNKHHKDVQKLIAGPHVFICDECIGVCNDILADDARTTGRAEIEPQVAATEALPTTEPTTRIVICTLCRLPLPWEDALPVSERGTLCPGCTSAIEAALAERSAGP
jgi:hypothetical protein